MYFAIKTLHPFCVCNLRCYLTRNQIEYFSVMRVENEKELFDEESEVVDNEPLVGQISFEELLSELRM